MTRGEALTASLSLELLNTAAGDSGQRDDLLTDLTGLERWLTSVGLTGPRYPVSIRSLQALHRVRAAIGRHLEDPNSGRACAGLNEALRWGRHRPAVTPDGPAAISLVDDVDRRAAWEAAMNYIQLSRRDMGQLRRCGRPGCARYLLGTSRNRRCCSEHRASPRARRPVLSS